MYTTYATLNTKITKAIRNHLMDVDALPPTMAMAELASELTDVVFAEMNNVGLTKEAIDSVDSAKSEQAKTTSQNAA